MKIVCYGDSNTYGYDPRSFVGGKYERTWTQVLEEKTGHQVIKMGMNGRQIPFRPRPLEQMHEMLGNDHYDLLVIMLGTNDIEACLNNTVVEARMASMIKEVKKWEIADHILLVGPPINTSTIALIQACQDMNKSFQKLAGLNGLHYVDSSAWNLQMAHDHCHLTLEDQDIFGEEIAKVISGILGK